MVFSLICANLPSHQQLTSTCYLSSFFITVILISVRKYFIAVLICIFLMISDVWHHTSQCVAPPEPSVGMSTYAYGRSCSVWLLRIGYKRYHGTPCPVSWVTCSGTGKSCLEDTQGRYSRPSSSGNKAPSNATGHWGPPTAQCVLPVDPGQYFDLTS
jgi:hypothetical protein